MTPNDWAFLWQAMMDSINLAGFGIVIWTFIRVSAVRRALREERSQLEKLLALDDLTAIMRRAARRILTTKPRAETALAEQIYEMVGVVDGVLATLKARDEIAPPPGADLIISGYFSMQFLRDEIAKAKRYIDIIVFRPTMLINIDVIEELRTASRRGVRVQVLSMAADADRTMLQEACRTMPNPRAPTMEALVGQLDEARKYCASNITGVWSSAELSRFDYRTYSNFPAVHLFRRDSTVTLGFPITLTSSQPDNKAARPGLRVPVASKLGRQLTTHFDMVFSDAMSLVKEQNDR